MFTPVQLTQEICSEHRDEQSGLVASYKPISVNWKQKLELQGPGITSSETTHGPVTHPETLSPGRRDAGREMKIPDD